MSVTNLKAKPNPLHRFYSCGSRSGTPAWDSHFDDLIGMHCYALSHNKPGLASMAADLIEAHLQKQQEYELSRRRDKGEAQ